MAYTVKVNFLIHVRTLAPSGLILHSPIMSGIRVLTASRLLSCWDIYPNIERIKSVQCPVFIIHGMVRVDVVCGAVLCVVSWVKCCVLCFVLCCVVRRVLCCVSSLLLYPISPFPLTPLPYPTPPTT
jgi:hypothetical protein